ncbi:MAG: hypothetical protein ABIL40_11765 [candidate division WOR-3 bacterium]
MKVLFYYPVTSAKRYEPQIAIKGSAFFRRPNYDAMRLAYLSRDCNFYYFDERTEERFEISPDLIVLPVPLHLAYYSQTLAQKWRSENIKTVAYGLYPALFISEAKKHFDVVVRGDITAVWRDILNDFRNDNLAEVYEAGERSISFRVDREYEKKYGLTPIISQLRTAYGCYCAPEFRDYCYESILHKTPHLWNVDEIFREVAVMPRKMIYIMDDDFLHNFDYACEILRRCWRLKKMWIFQTKGTLFKHPQLVQFLKEHGVRIIYLKEDWLGGNLVQDIYRKDFVKEKEYEVNMIHGSRMTVGAKILLGFDGENPKFYRDFLRFLINIKVDFVEIAVRTPLPFTETYKKLEKNKRINKDISLYDRWMPVVRLEGMGQNELYNQLEFLRD